jgi:predicted GIY-YIG superfamily endonuclease
VTAEAKPATSYTVYRLYDAERNLLYVGITNNVRARFRWHASNQPWWLSVADVESEEVASREEAIDRELALINALRPRHNIVTTRRNPKAGEFELNGSRVRALRLARGMDIGELSRASGVHRDTISRLERGEYVGESRPSTVRKLAGALDIDDPRELLED